MKEIHKNTYSIYNADCLEVLRKLPESSIECIITSPPYNIGKSYEDFKTTEAYLEWCSSWLKELNRVLTEQGTLLLSLGYTAVEGKGRAIPLPYLFYPLLDDFYLQQEIVWNYGAGVACKNYLSPRNEKVLWLVKDPKNYTFNLDPIRDPDVKYPNQKRGGKLRCNPLGKNPSDVWKIPKVTSGKGRSSSEKVDHPCQTPLQLVDMLVRGFTNEGDTILDIFMGSASIGVGAVNNNRNFIGIEMLELYFELSKERLGNV